MKVIISLFFIFLVESLASSPTSSKPEAGNQCFMRQDLVVRAPGFLYKVHVAEGSTVASGTLIAELDSRLLQTARKEAKAGFDAAKANLDLATDGFQRMQKLKGSDSVSAQELFAASVRQNQARAALNQAEAVFERTEIQVEDTLIRARISGRVLGLPNVLGLYVQAGQSLGRIEVTDNVCQPTR